MKIAAAIEAIQVAGSKEPRHTVALQTRVRILRNIDETFPGRLNDEERQLQRERLFDHIAGQEGELELICLEELVDAERQALFELGVTASEGPQGAERRGLLLMDDPRLSVLLAEREHFCIQCRRDGLALQEAYAQVDCLDANLEEQVDFAFSEEFGYLTASPRRAGTGLDCRVILHLPALAIRGEMTRILRGLTALSAEPRLIGDGEGPGSLVVLRNAHTFGWSESEILAQLAQIVGKLAELEERARDCLISEAWSLLEDRVWTAYGQLRYGRLLGEEAADELLGTLRLGCLVGILQSIDIVEVEEHWLRSRNGSLQIETGKTLSTGELEALRARRFRDWLAD
jgi:protein arginine kinase